MNLKEYLKKRKTDLIFILILIIFFLTLNIINISGMKQLPSPIYGGDFYYQLGCINHIRYGGEAFDNCNLISDTSAYMPLFGIIEAGFANFFGFEDTIKSILFFSNILIILSILISYTLFKLILKKSIFAFLGTFLFSPIRPIIKYTTFGTYLMAPLFIIAFFLFYKKQNIKRAIFLGITIGLMSITHSVLFPAAYFTIAALFIFLIFDKKINLKKDKKIIFSNIKKTLPLFLIIAVIAIPITLLYWSGPIFKHQMQTSPHYLEWNGPGDMSKTSLQLKMANNILKGTFFTFSSILKIFTSALAIFGILFFILIKNRDENTQFIIFLLIILTILTFSYFITMPLFKTHFVPDYMFSVFGSIIITCFILISFQGASTLIKNIKTPFEKKKILIILFLIILTIIIFNKTDSVKEYKTNDKWHQVSQKPLSANFIELQEVILKKTNVNDVFLTTKETGFMLNALTGRKLLTGRRAQNDAFENLDKREIEQAIILYGNNTEIKKKLIEKYNIKYLYWDSFWIQSEYTINEKGEVTGWFDPLIAFENPEYKKELDKNKVKYFIKKEYVDPTLKTKYHPTFDLIFISPENYKNFTNPWNPNLNNYLEEIWNYKQDGQKIAALYKINIKEE
jgi:hypothetical protein